jgi:hypothetical protein
MGDISVVGQIIEQLIGQVETAVILIFQETFQV